QLQLRGLAVLSHSYDYLNFGSWTIVVGTRHHRARMTWDGRESHFLLQTSEFRGSGASASWKESDTLQVPRGTEDIPLFNRAAALIISHFHLVGGAPREGGAKHAKEAAAPGRPPDREGVNLVCGRRRPQLMRDPLGCSTE